MSQLGQITACYTIRFERTSKHSAARLWRAITNPQAVAKWWAMPSARVDLRVGGEYFVEFPPEVDDDLDGVIVLVEPERQLRYEWGMSVVDWQMSDNDSGCAFTFTHHGQTPGLVDQEGGIAGGYDFGLLRLEAYLDGHDRIDEEDEHWRTATATYTQRIREVMGKST